MNAQFRTEELFGFNVHFQEEFLIDVVITQCQNAVTVEFDFVKSSLQAA